MYRYNYKIMTIIIGSMSKEEFLEFLKAIFSLFWSWSTHKYAKYYKRFTICDDIGGGGRQTRNFGTEIT